MRARLAVRAAGVAALACLCGACSRGRDAPHWTERDSAGIRIVTSDPTAVDGALRLEPVLTIGTVGDGGPTEFYRVRDVELVGGSRLAVANAGSEQVRVFDFDGRLLHAFGRAGRGPRELRGLRMVDDVADSLFTYDSGNDRIAVRLFDGTFVRSFRLEWFAGMLSPVHLAPDGGSLAVTARHMVQLEGTGVVVDTALVSIYDPVGNLVDSVARLPHNERFVKQVGNMRTTVGTPYSSFAGLVRVADGFCYAFGPEAQVSCFGEDGRLREIARVAVPPRPVGEEHIDRYWADLEAEANEGRRDVIRRLRDDMAFPERFPALSALLVDDEGRVWAQRYRLPEAEDETWWVLEDGRIVARMSSPVGFEVMDVERGLVAGVWRDELDVEHVRVYRMAWVS